MKTVFHKYKGILPLIILAGLCAHNFALAYFPIIDKDTYAILNYKHFLAGLTVIINLILFLTYRQIYKYSLFITLILGTFEIVNFMRPGSHLNIGAISIGFHVMPLLIGLFTMILYSERFRKNPTDSSGVPFETIAIDNTQIFQEEVEKFKLKFKESSAETLAELCIDTRYSDSAKQAAKQILEERAERS